MKRLLVTLVLSALIAAAAVAAMAQAAPPAAPSAVPPAAAAAPGGAPRLGAPMMSNSLPPAPCVSSAMRVIHPRMMPTLDERLKLTADQKVKINDLLAKSETDSTQLVLAQRKASEDFVTVLTNPNSTEAEITAAAKKAMDAETAIISAKAATMIQLRSMLTAEQKSAFTEMLNQYTLMWQNKPGARPAGGPAGAPGAPVQIPSAPK